MWALKPISSRPGARATAGCGPLLSDNLNYPTGSECRPSLTPSSESPSPSQARANLWTGVPARRADCSQCSGRRWAAVGPAWGTMIRRRIGVFYQKEHFKSLFSINFGPRSSNRHSSRPPPGGRAARLDLEIMIILRPRPGARGLRASGQPEGFCQVLRNRSVFFLRPDGPGPRPRAGRR